MVLVAVILIVLVAVILIVLVVNSISSNCGSSKILIWTGKYKSGVGARAGKYKLGARAGCRETQRPNLLCSRKNPKNQKIKSIHKIVSSYLFIQ